MSQNNSRLHEAKRAKMDEFYTRIEDVEQELGAYSDGTFADKVVYLNCDDPRHSAFWRHFCIKFGDYGLRGLIATHYTGVTEPGKPSFKIEAWRGRDDVNIGHDAHGKEVRWIDPKTGGVQSALKGDGDFRSDECIELLEQSDVVVTNPPFSLFRDFMAQIMECEKQFLVIGNMNAITYKEIWPYIQDGKLWLGVSHPKLFDIPDDAQVKPSQFVNKDGRRVQIFGNICWFTNLDHHRRHEPIYMVEHYNPDDYPTYDNYNAINIDKVKLIPKDYDGVMGVPITFLDKWNPEQFEIVGCSYDYGRPVDFPENVSMSPIVGGKNIYKRIFIRRKLEFIGL